MKYSKDSNLLETMSSAAIGLWRSLPPVIIALLLATVTCSAQRPSLTTVPAWGYQLQDIDAGQIATNPSFQLIVMDYSSDGTDDTRFTSSELRAIRESGKIAIAYFSIGEAEDYRFYWEPGWNSAPPAWLGPENPGWPGNFKVRFWDPDWQSIVFEYLDIIIAQGFDGIYLDIVDGFWYWMHENPEQSNADTLMLDFISAIRTHAETRTSAPFYIIPQNPDDILHSDNVTAAMRNAFLNDIDAVGVEDVFCPGGMDENNPFAPNEDRLKNLREIHDAGKAVFSIEYLTQQDIVTQFISGAHAEGFIPYTCTRELSMLCDGVVTTVLHSATSVPGTIILSVSPHPIVSDALLQIHNKEALNATILIQDIAGRTVMMLHSGLLETGEHRITIPATSLPSGSYTILLRTRSGVLRKSMMVLR